MSDLVTLYDAEGRVFVADPEDVDRRLGDGYLRERPAVSDRTAPVVAVHNMPAPPSDAELVAPDDGGWPARNATTAEWREAVVSRQLATDDEVAGMGRDELRDKFGPTA